MNREQAYNELSIRITNPNLIKHSIAVEAIMAEFADFYKEDVETWSLAGLLHDIDLEKIDGDMNKHGNVGATILENLGVDSSIVYAVRAHNDINGVKRKRKMDKLLYSSDPASGLIVAATLVLPTKKLKDLTIDTLMNRFNEKGFAKGANREQIKECEELGILIEQFLDISLKALKKISGELGL